MNMNVYDHVLCNVCGKSISVSGNDFGPIHNLPNGEHICSGCICRIQVLYPTRYVTENGKTRIVSTYTVHTAAELKASFDKAHEFREELIQKYGYHCGAFEVAAVQSLKGGLFQPECLNIFGRPLYGDFFVYDEVEIDHNGSIVKATVDAVHPDSRAIPFKGQSMKDLKWDVDHNLVYSTISEGNVGILIFKGKNFEVSPGDIILK